MEYRSVSQRVEATKEKGASLAILAGVIKMLLSIASRTLLS